MKLGQAIESAFVVTDLKTFLIMCDANTQSYSLGAIAITSIIKVSLMGGII